VQGTILKIAFISQIFFVQLRNEYLISFLRLVYIRHIYFTEKRELNTEEHGIDRINVNPILLFYVQESHLKLIQPYDFTGVIHLLFRSIDLETIMDTSHLCKKIKG